MCPPKNQQLQSDQVTQIPATATTLQTVPKQVTSNGATAEGVLQDRQASRLLCRNHTSIGFLTVTCDAAVE